MEGAVSTDVSSAGRNLTAIQRKAGVAFTKIKEEFMKHNLQITINSVL